MAHRFIEPDWKALRKLTEQLQRAWFYLWDKADSCGVYHYDPEYLKLDLNLNEGLSLLDLGTLPECEILPGERILIKNFLIVNYKSLKPDYNPHKPAFRDLCKNGLTLNSSLTQACLKLEEEDKDKEEDEDRKGGAGEKQKLDEKDSPKLETVERVFTQQGGTREMATAFFNRYEAVQWKIRGSPVKDFSKLVGTFIINWRKNKENGSTVNHKSSRDKQTAANADLIAELKQFTRTG